MTQSTLAKLKLTTRPEKPVLNPLEAKKNKLITRLEEQQAMVKCHLENGTYTAYKIVWVTDEESGEKRKIKQPKKVRAWFYQVDGIYYFEIRYGNKALELQKGKPAIQVGKAENLLTTIDTIIEAVKQGELDSQLNQVTGPRKAKV
jgi:hypothetical protein